MRSRLRGTPPTSDGQRSGPGSGVIPGGGSNGLGALGYVRCALELTEQLSERDDRPRYVVCAGGSCGTLSGLTLGLALAGSDTQLAAGTISTSVPDPVARAREIRAESADYLDLPLPPSCPAVWSGQ